MGLKSLNPSLARPEVWGNILPHLHPHPTTLVGQEKPARDSRERRVKFYYRIASQCMNIHVFNNRYVVMNRLGPFIAAVRSATYIRWRQRTRSRWSRWVSEFRLSQISFLVIQFWLNWDFYSKFCLLLSLSFSHINFGPTNLTEKIYSNQLNLSSPLHLSSAYNLSLLWLRHTSCVSGF